MCELKYCCFVCIWLLCISPPTDLNQAKDNRWFFHHPLVGGFAISPHLSIMDFQGLQGSLSSFRTNELGDIGPSLKDIGKSVLRVPHTPCCGYRDELFRIVLLWQSFYSKSLSWDEFVPSVVSVLLLCAKHQAGLWECRGEFVMDLPIGNSLGKRDIHIQWNVFTVWPVLDWRCEYSIYRGSEWGMTNTTWEMWQRLHRGDDI